MYIKYKYKYIFLTDAEINFQACSKSCEYCTYYTNFKCKILQGQQNQQGLLKFYPCSAVNHLNFRDFANSLDKYLTPLIFCLDILLNIIQKWQLV